MLNNQTKYTVLISTANGGGYEFSLRSAPVAH